MKKKKMLKRLLGIVLAICLVCSGSFADFGLGTTKADATTATVSHEIPANVSRYKVSYTGQQRTMLYNATPMNWTDATTVYLTYKVDSYTAGKHLQGYCGTSTVDGYPYDENTGMVTRSNDLTLEGAKSEVLKVGYTYFVAFDVTNNGMTVRAERVKDGVTEIVSYDRMYATGGGTVDCSLLKYFGLYLGESAYTAILSEVSIYDVNGNDLGVTGRNLPDGAIQKLPERVEQKLPENVSRYKVAYTGYTGTLYLCNQEAFNWTTDTTIYMTYTVDSYSGVDGNQAFIGTTEAKYTTGYPYGNDVGTFDRGNVANTGKNYLMAPGYTYYVAYDLTNSGVGLRIDRVKDGVTESVQLPTGNSYTMTTWTDITRFGLYLMEATTATISNVSIYDEEGRDLGVQCPDITTYPQAGTITKLPDSVNHEILEDVSRYKVVYTGHTGTLYLCNQEAFDWTTDTTIYMTYTVDSYSGVDGNQAFIGTTESYYTTGYPYGDDKGTFDRGNVANTGKNYLMAPGYTYYVAYNLTNSGVSLRIDRVKDGVTESVQLPTGNSNTMTTWTDITRFGLYLMEATTATLSNVSIYDEEGRDLGVQCPDITTYPQAGTITKLPDPVSHEIPEDVSRYHVVYTGYTGTLYLCNQTALDWTTDTTIYMTYTVDSYGGVDGNQGFIGTTELYYTEAYPYGDDKGTFDRGNVANTGKNYLMAPGYTYYVAYDLTSSGASVRIERVKDGVTESVQLPTGNSNTMTTWTDITRFGLYLMEVTTATISNVSIYDGNGRDLGVQCPDITTSSKNGTIEKLSNSAVTAVAVNHVLTVVGSGSISASMMEEAIAKQCIRKENITEICVMGNITRIQWNVFQGFTALEKVYIKDCVEKVSENAFVNCATGVTVSCAPGYSFAGGLQNASVINYTNVEFVGTKTSFTDGTLSLHLVPTAAISGVLKETTYTGLSVKIDDGEVQEISVTKTSYETLAFELTGLEEECFTLTIPAGVAKSEETINGVSGFELLEDVTVYVSKYVVTTQPLAGTNVTATVEADGANGLYFTTSSEEDKLAVGGTSDSANIYSYKGNDNGVFINGEKTEAYLRKVETDRYSVCLSDAGYSVANGDIVTVSGCFQYGEELIVFEPCTVKYTIDGVEGTWSEMTSGTISMKDAILDADLDAGYTYVVEGNSAEVWYPNQSTATKVADKTVLDAVGDYTVLRTMGKVTFQTKVVIYKTGDVNADGTLNVVDLVALKKATSKQEESYQTSAGQYAAQTLINDGEVTDKAVVLRTKLVQPLATKTPVVAYSFEAIGGKDVMPIVGYYGPRPLEDIDAATTLPDPYTDEYFSLIASTGINILGHNKTDYASNPSLVIKMLQLSEKYGMGMFVTDSRILDSSTNLTVEMVDEYLNDYVNYPAYCGNDVIDEPDWVGFYGTADSPVIMHRYFPVMENLNALNVFGVSNLLPMKAGKTSRYADYVNAWLEGANPKVLSYDYYPFDDNVGYGKARYYFQNMAVIREAAEKESIPFWTFIQAGSQWYDVKEELFDSSEYYPSQGEFYWNVGTSLAYGAKGIQYFPLIQPYTFALAKSTSFDAERNGLIGIFGNKTRWYYYAQDMNKQIAAVDEILMNAVNQGVIAVGTLANKHLSGDPYLLEGTSWRELVNAKGNAMIGCFTYNGKTALYVVNYDTKQAQTIELELGDICNVTVVQDAKKGHLSTNKLSLDLTAGNSALIVFE